MPPRIDVKSKECTKRSFMVQRLFLNEPIRGLARFLGTMAPHHRQEEFTFGFIFLLPGISLLIYYVIANRHFRREKERPTE
jgi:hypothetical protein